MIDVNNTKTEMRRGKDYNHVDYYFAALASLNELTIMRLDQRASSITCCWFLFNSESEVTIENFPINELSSLSNYFNLLLKMSEN